MLLTVKISKKAYDNEDLEKLFNEIKSYLKKSDKKDFRKILTEHLESNNQRKTVERYTIMEIVIQEQTKFSVNSVHKKVSKELIVSSMTVRNTFKLFIDMGIIQVLDTNQKNELFNTTYFELV